MQNNFQLIKEFCAKNPDFVSEDGFLFGQIMMRRKDVDMSSNNRIIKDFIIRDEKSFGRKEKEIVDLCNFFGARAYINVSPRSYKKVCLKMAQLALEYVEYNHEKQAISIFSAVCGRMKPKNNYWVIDIDDLGQEEEAFQMIPEVSLRVPTVNGVHLIAKGFDPRPLTSKFSDIAIQKNNPTLLFAP